MYAEFEQSLKPIYIEEIFDLVIYRPIAFILIKLSSGLPITPNQVSALGIAMGLMSGLVFSIGTRTAFIVAGVLYLAAVVLDCGDGMLARLKKNGSKIGRVMDGLSDYTTTTAVLLGMAVGLSRASVAFPVSHWLLLGLAGLNSAVQCLIVDHYKNKFVAHGLGQARHINVEIQEYEAELERLNEKKGRWIKKALVRLYIGYTRLQARGQHRRPVYNQEEYFCKNRVPVRLWTFIGPSVQRGTLILAAFLYRPELYFYFAFLFGNFWMAFLLIWQYFVKRSLKVEARQLA